MKSSTIKRISQVTLATGVVFIPMGYLTAGVIWIGTGVVGLLTARLGKSVGE